MELQVSEESERGIGERDLEKILEEVFGHRAFREGQREVMEVLLDGEGGRSALAIFPTGAGKSLCYQLPALMLPGLTLVISPLIALMRDQVVALTARGVPAARLDSSLEAAEVREIYDRMADGRLKLLYVAPERLANEGFLGKLRGTRISMLAIDEAHCISEWGHNFRPDYLKLGLLAREVGVERVLCLTATATPRVAADIREHFNIRKEDEVRTDFRRENLEFRVTPCPAEGRKALLLERLFTRSLEGKGSVGEGSVGEGNDAAIVYVTLQHTAEDVAGFLAREGFRARAYHAGLSDECRCEVQDGFMAGEIDIVVATIAFGMGIDKADVRAVYHYNLPKSLENYVQESGRAGRDGEKAVCEILACGDDRIVLENFVYGDTPSRAALQALVEHLLLQGDEFDISRYHLSGTKDIRPLVVATALTYLELSGVIEALGPFYATYQFRFLQPEGKIFAGHGAEQRGFLEKIFAAAGAGRYERSWRTVEIAPVAEVISESPERVREALHHLSKLEDVVVRPSGLRHAYRLGTEEKRDVVAITLELQGLFEKRERGEIARIERVTAYAESGSCLTRELMGYFGEEVDEDCGSCGNCIVNQEGAEKSADTPSRLPCGLDEDLSLEQVEWMREVIDEERPALRQPHQLARFFCGIGSPAATRAKLKRHERFGALARVPFQAVLGQAESMVML